MLSNCLGLGTKVGLLLINALRSFLGATMPFRLTSPPRLSASLILCLFLAMAALKRPPALVDPTVVVVVVVSGLMVVGARVGRVGAGLVVNCSVVVSNTF